MDNRSIIARLEHFTTCTYQYSHSSENRETGSTEGNINTSMSTSSTIVIEPLFSSWRFSVSVRQFPRKYPPVHRNYSHELFSLSNNGLLEIHTCRPAHAATASTDKQTKKRSTFRKLNLQKSSNTLESWASPKSQSVLWHVATNYTATKHIMFYEACFVVVNVIYS